ncbi:MAG: DNA-binding protein Alba [Candidatus Aenigmarchaeota archaeon]|nr:DNA-binding protein Alba [Candidatus Aenigmarchaeota archaeon]
MAELKENVVLVGQKPLMSYVLAIVTQLSNSGEVTIKARGKVISKAVDVAQIAKNKFAKDVKIGEIKIGTDEVEAKEGGKINVSTIEIPLKK